jgi:hypothetical protein
MGGEIDSFRLPRIALLMSGAGRRAAEFLQRDDPV